ncbi:MAG: hypothetical protein QG661_3229 [Actinomycetota bacterium]|nr:hypothetical protein [Actinomycetota bacterium]
MTVIVEVETHRRRERNIVRSVDVLPPDIETKVGALRTLDGAAQAAAVTAMLSHSRTGLLAAIAAQDLPQIVEWKAKGAAIQEIAKQVRLGKELRLDADEFVRRAERGLGVAVRGGQQRGDVLRQGQRADHIQAQQENRDTVISRPTDYASPHELSGEPNGFGIYGMTDGVSDEQFEDAIAEARAEGNLSRANVARKAKAKATAVIDADDPLIDAEVEPPPPPAVKSKKRLTKHDSTEMLTNIAGMLGGVVEAIRFMHPNDIDAAQARPTIENIRQSIGAVRKLLKEIENG